MIKKTQSMPSLFSNLSDMLDQSHPLYKLADDIDWRKLGNAFEPLYCPDNGRPGKPIRLMCGLLILKHLRNLSDESVVEQWSENAYFQYFCGMREFSPFISMRINGAGTFPQQDRRGRHRAHFSRKYPRE